MNGDRTITATIGTADFIGGICAAIVGLPWLALACLTFGTLCAIELKADGGLQGFFWRLRFAWIVGGAPGFGLRPSFEYAAAAWDAREPGQSPRDAFLSDLQTWDAD